MGSAVYDDHTPVLSDHSGYDLYQGRLAGSIFTDKAVYLALSDVHAHAVESLYTDIGLAHVFRFEEILSHEQSLLFCVKVRIVQERQDHDPLHPTLYQKKLITQLKMAIGGKNISPDFASFIRGCAVSGWV
jgi:hypothetical protein